MFVVHGGARQGHSRHLWIGTGHLPRGQDILDHHDLAGPACAKVVQAHAAWSLARQVLGLLLREHCPRLPDPSGFRWPVERAIQQGQDDAAGSHVVSCPHQGRICPIQPCLQEPEHGLGRPLFPRYQRGRHDLPVHVGVGLALRLGQGHPLGQAQDLGLEAGLLAAEAVAAVPLRRVADHQGRIMAGCAVVSNLLGPAHGQSFGFIQPCHTSSCSYSVSCRGWLSRKGSHPLLR